MVFATFPVARQRGGADRVRDPVAAGIPVVDCPLEHGDRLARALVVGDVAERLLEADLVGAFPERGRVRLERPCHRMEWTPRRGLAFAALQDSEGDGTSTSATIASTPRSTLRASDASPAWPSESIGG